MKSPEEIASSAPMSARTRCSSPALPSARSANSIAGIQVTYNQGQLKQLILAGTHRVMTSITSLGSTCQATVTYELEARQGPLRVTDDAGTSQVNISALTSEAVSCKVSKGDAVGAPPNGRGITQCGGSTRAPIARPKVQCF